MDGFSILGLLNEQDTIVSFEDDWLPAIATDDGGKSPTSNVASHYPWSFSPISDDGCGNRESKDSELGI